MKAQLQSDVKDLIIKPFVGAARTPLHSARTPLLGDVPEDEELDDVELQFYRNNTNIISSIIKKIFCCDY